ANVRATEAQVPTAIVDATTTADYSDWPTPPSRRGRGLSKRCSNPAIDPGQLHPLPQSRGRCLAAPTAPRVAQNLYPTSRTSPRLGFFPFSPNISSYPLPRFLISPSTHRFPDIPNQHHTTTTTTMPAQKTSSYLADLERDGFVVVKSIVSPEKLQRLRDAATKVEAIARRGEWPHIRTVGKQFPPWQWEPEKGIWGVQHLMNPALPGHEAFTELYFSDEVLDIVKQLLQCDDEQLVMELFNMLASAAEEMERLARPGFHAQYNFALWEDESLVLVPGSHARARTDTERSAGPFEPVLPDQLVVRLEAGDIAFYNNNILHRGVYDSKKDRVTLHGSVGHAGGNKLRARNVLQHGIGKWVDGVDFSQLKPAERERAEAMRARLVKMGSDAGDVGYSLQG
ncbi:hypothetical protein LLEC1_08103, partial [Akanthomyces lecanii]